MDAGFVGQALRRRGFSFIEMPREDPGVWPTPGDVGLVVSLGSSWSAYWPEISGPAEAERRFLRDAHATSVPVLGLCFGAQQLSLALGGAVERSQVHEIGWHTVTPMPESTGDTAGALGGKWFQWHYDRFSVPAGATALADSPASPQAFVSGRSLGLQFHPEVTESMVVNWCSGTGADELEAAGIEREALLAETRTLLDTVRPRTEALVEWFLLRVAQMHP